MASKVMKRCFNVEKVRGYAADLVSFSKPALLHWMYKREPGQLRALSAELGRPLDLDSSISYFKLMVKRDAKVKLDSTCLVKHPPAQNIMFHSKAINALFSPIFDEIKNRVIDSLNSNIAFYTEMDHDKFASLCSAMVGDDDSMYHIGEVDFSKFDKSQDVFVKEFEREVYRCFGFEPELLDVWMQGEYNARAKSLDGKLAFNVTNQRRSGGSNTWLGNSLVTLGILAMYYDVTKLSALFISGDDSLMYSTEPLKNHAEVICVETGFETKFMSPSVPYFCSKFVVHCGHRTYFVPDPYKLLVKLGAPRSEPTEDNLFEVFVSFKDLTKHFSDERVIRKVAELMSVKYQFESPYTLPALHSIHCINANFKNFLSLYPKVSGWVVVKHLTKWVLKFFGNKISFTKFNTPDGERYFGAYEDSPDE
ncbi:polymerase [Dregea volubilis virus 1]|nr:polymerase [Dregea volubilis virus 1]